MSRIFTGAGTTLIFGAGIYLLVIAGVFCSCFDQGQNIVLQMRERSGLLALSILNALIINSVFCHSLWKRGLLMCVAGALLFACVTDCRMQQVYQFTWWWAGAAGMLLLLTTDILTSKVALAAELSFLCLCQELLFSKMYGRADCHAFCACGMVLLALGGGLEGCLFHIITAFGILAVVQGVRGNIGKGGKMRRPVAFLPYITTSFWMTVSYLTFFKGFGWKL